MAPIYSGSLDVRPDQGISSLGSSWAQMGEAETAESLSSLPSAELFRAGTRAIQSGHPEFAPGLAPEEVGALRDMEAAQPTPEVSNDAAKQRLKDERLNLTLPDGPIKAPVLDLMIQHAKERAEREATIARGPSGFIPNALTAGTSFLVNAVDPLNVAAGFVPVIGEARYGKLLAAAGESFLQRLAVRGGVGAGQGAVGTAPLEAIHAAAETQDGQDYTFAQALHSLVLNAGLAGALHGGAGVVGDVLTRRMADLPPRVQEDALRSTVAAMVHDEPVRTGEVLQAAAERDPRIAETLTPEQGVERVQAASGGRGETRVTINGETARSEAEAFRDIATPAPPKDEVALAETSRLAETAPEPDSVHPALPDESFGRFLRRSETAEAISPAAKAAIEAERAVDARFQEFMAEVPEGQREGFAAGLSPEELEAFHEAEIPHPQNFTSWLITGPGGEPRRARLKDIQRPPIAEALEQMNRDAKTRAEIIRRGVLCLAAGFG